MAMMLWVLSQSQIWLDILSRNLVQVNFRLLKYGKYSFDFHRWRMIKLQNIRYTAVVIMVVLSINGLNSANYPSQLNPQKMEHTLNCMTARHRLEYAIYATLRRI